MSFVESRRKEVGAEAALVLGIGPNFFLERWAKKIPFRQALVDQLVGVLRKAGLK